MTTLPTVPPTATAPYLDRHWCVTEKVLAPNVVEVEVALGMGLYVKRRIFLSDFNVMLVENLNLMACKQAAIAIAGGGQRMIIEMADTEEAAFSAVLLRPDPPSLLDTLRRTVVIKGVELNVLSVGEVLSYYNPRNYPKAEIQNLFGR